MKGKRWASNRKQAASPSPNRGVARSRRFDRQRVGELLERLDRTYPNANCALGYRNAYELLVATILSAQCTDVRVNQVTPALFQQFPSPEALSRAPQEELEKLIRSTGFFRNKAKNLIGMAKSLVRDFNGRVPNDMGNLIKLPGVARKTANVVLGVIWNIASGVVVDTHVQRISRLLGLTRHTDPTKIEKNLMGLIPRDQWIKFGHQVIHHGRRICIARRPKCSECSLSDLCPSSTI